MTTEQTYLNYFASLHTNKMRGQIAPHKPILLLSVIDLIKSGRITSNEIELTESLEEQFAHNWSRYVGESSIFKPNVETPFWHLNYESFGTLVPYEGGDETISRLQQGNPYSPNTIRKHIRHARMDKELFELLRDKATREKY